MSLQKTRSLTRRELTLFKEVESLFGDREGLVTAIAAGEATDHTEYLLRLLGDPDHDRLSLAEICEAGKIRLSDLLTAVRKGHLLKAHVAAHARLAKYLPEIAEDVAKRALPSQEVCEGCGGSGTRAAGEDHTCPTCRGQGQVTIIPDLARQKFALELGQLYTPKGGPTFQQQINLPGSGLPSIEVMQATMERHRRSAEGPPQSGGTGSDPPEAEVVDGETL